MLSLEGANESPHLREVARWGDLHREGVIPSEAARPGREVEESQSSRQRVRCCLTTDRSRKTCTPDHRPAGVERLALGERDSLGQRDAYRRADGLVHGPVARLIDLFFRRVWAFAAWRPGIVVQRQNAPLPHESFARRGPTSVGWTVTRCGFESRRSPVVLPTRGARKVGPSPTTCPTCGPTGEGYLGFN